MWQLPGTNTLSLTIMTSAATRLHGNGKGSAFQPQLSPKWDMHSTSPYRIMQPSLRLLPSEPWRCVRTFCRGGAQALWQCTDSRRRVV